MSRALHIGFAPVVEDPARHFLRTAPGMLHADSLAAAFVAALAPEGATAHLCCAVDEDGTLLPLIGDDRRLVRLVPGVHVRSFPVETHDGEALVVRIALRAVPDRERRARLALLASVYATHMLVLLEAEDEAMPADALTAMEQHCLGLTAAGRSSLDIGEQLGLSAPAVRIVLRRAAAKLGVESIAEACKVAVESHLSNNSLFPIGNVAKLL